MCTEDRLEALEGRRYLLECELPESLHDAARAGRLFRLKCPRPEEGYYGAAADGMVWAWPGGAWAQRRPLDDAAVDAYDFFDDQGEKVWACNSAYAEAHFDLVPVV